MNRSVIRFFAGLCLMTASLYAQTAAGFGRYPFDQWAAAGGRDQIAWTVEAGPAALSEHQRQMLPIVLEVRSREIDKRRAHGGLVFLVRLSAGSAHWEQMTPMSFRQLSDSVKPPDMRIDFRVFIEPGTYVLECAVYDAASNEHSFSRRNVVVKPLDSDPLPGAGGTVPSVEFIVDHDSPDSWFLPSSRGGLDLPVAVGRADLQLLVNTTTSEEVTGRVRSTPRHLERVLPVLKVMAGIHPLLGSNTLRFLDLAKRRVSYEQDIAGGIEWPKLRPVVVAANTGITDVEALQMREGMLRYFGEEVRRSLSEKEASQVVIVMSAPTRFDRQDKRKLPVEALRDKRLFYLQCWAAVGVATKGTLGLGSGPIVPNGMAGQIMYAQQQMEDDLERVLRPMGARIFHISSPWELRVAVAEILREIGNR